MVLQLRRWPKVSLHTILNGVMGTIFKHHTELPYHAR